MALVAGISTSYRPSYNHIGEERLCNTLEVVNKRKNKNATITEGLELLAIKEVGSVEEKLKIMGITYKDIRFTKEASLSINNYDNVIEFEDDDFIGREKNNTKKCEPVNTTGNMMIKTMNRE